MVANINFGDKGIGGQQDNGSPKKIFGALVGFFKIIFFNNIFSYPRMHLHFIIKRHRDPHHHVPGLISYLSASNSNGYLTHL
jgi:hypothetical protein